MKKFLVALISSIIFISGCGGSNDNTVGTVSNNYGNTVTMGDSMLDVYEVLENLAYDSSKPPLDDGIHNFDGIEIIARDGVVRVLNIADMNYLSDSKTVWQTGEGIKIGSTREEVIEAYSFVKADEWYEDSDLSLDSTSDLMFTKEFGKYKCAVAFTFDDNNEVYIIVYMLLGE